MNVLCLRMIHNIAYLLCLYLNNSVVLHLLYKLYVYDFLHILL